MFRWFACAALALTLAQAVAADEPQGGDMPLNIKRTSPTAPAERPNRTIEESLGYSAEAEGPVRRGRTIEESLGYSAEGPVRRGRTIEESLNHSGWRTSSRSRSNAASRTGKSGSDPDVSIRSSPRQLTPAQNLARRQARAAQRVMVNQQYERALIQFFKLLMQLLIIAFTLVPAFYMLRNWNRPVILLLLTIGFGTIIWLAWQIWPK